MQWHSLLRSKTASSQNVQELLQRAYYHVFMDHLAHPALTDISSAVQHADTPSAVSRRLLRTVLDEDKLAVHRRAN